LYSALHYVRCGFVKEKCSLSSGHLGKTPLDILMETYSELYELHIDSWRGVQLLAEAIQQKHKNSLLKRKCIFSC